MKLSFYNLKIIFLLTSVFNVFIIFNFILQMNNVFLSNNIKVGFFLVDFRK